MIGFFIGCVVGGTVGVIVMAACIVGAQSDAHIKDDTYDQNQP